MNAAIHQWTAAIATGAALHSREVEHGEATAWPLAGGGLAALLTKLPDLLEPAVHPHHLRDLHATILHLMGLDPGHLTYFYGGLENKLTGVIEPEIIRGILA